MIACHADHIGTLLRPSELVSAREDAASGRSEWDLNAFLWGNWRGDSATVGDRTIERPAGLGVVEKLRRRRHFRLSRRLNFTTTSPTRCS
jgi:hypothetical protein